MAEWVSGWFGLYLSIYLWLVGVSGQGAWTNMYVYMDAQQVFYISDHCFFSVVFQQLGWVGWVNRLNLPRQTGSIRHSPGKQGR